MISGAMILVFSGVLVFIVLPYVADLYEKYSVLKVQSEQIEYMGDWKEKLDELQHSRGVLDERMDEMYVELATEEEFSNVIESLYEAAQSNYVSINKVQPLASESSGKYTNRGLEINFRGGYHSVARFINQIEQKGQVLRIQSIDLESLGGESSITILEGELRLEVILLRESS